MVNAHIMIISKLVLANIFIITNLWVLDNLPRSTCRVWEGPYCKLYFFKRFDTKTSPFQLRLCFFCYSIISDSYPMNLNSCRGEWG